MRHFTATQLKEFLDNEPENAVLIDVRERWEFEYCHIEGSTLVPMGQLPANLDNFDQEKDIVLICHHGIRSRQMGYYMEQMGFKNIINLDGGVEQWAEDVDSTMKRY